MNFNEIEAKGRHFALQVTAAFLLFLVILCLVIRIDSNSKYQELSIRLDSVPVAKEKIASSPKGEPVKAQKETSERLDKRNEDKQESQKQVKTAEKRIENTQKKADQVQDKANSDNSRQKFEEPKIKKSIEELMAENKSVKKKDVEFDESLFADDNSPVQAKESPSSKNVAVPKSSLSGSSASSGFQRSSASSFSSSSSDDNSVSASTASALDDIKNTVFSSTVTDGVKSKTSLQAFRSNGVVSMKMSDGSARQLLYPKSPSISISEENAMLVDATRSVTISFTVRADGTVPVVEIQISPGSLIPVEIQTEIKAQIKDWKFSEEPSGKNARAMFNYSLELELKQKS